MSKSTDPIAALEAQVVALQADRADLRKKLKRAQLRYGLYQTLAEEARALIVPFDKLPDPEPRHYSRPDKLIDETLVVHLSDAHADEPVEPHKVGGLEKFDFQVALCRAENYVDTIIDWTQNTLANHRFRKCVVMLNGDMTSGTIHDAENRSEFRNQLRNSLAIGQMVGLMMRDLAPHFEAVDVLCTSGNHGRRTIKKNYDGAWDNWDYLISEIAANYCRNLTNTKFHIPDAFSITLDIEGHGFCVAHGDDIKSWNSIPYYGIERKTRRLVSLHNSVGQRVSYFVFGHFHALATQADLKGETIINGAFPATNPYSYESFSGYREPMQLIHGVSQRYGITWRLPVKIKDEEKEARGPARYKVILAQPGFEGLSGQED